MEPDTNLLSLRDQIIYEKFNWRLYIYIYCIYQEFSEAEHYSIYGAENDNVCASKLNNNFVEQKSMKSVRKLLLNYSNCCTNYSIDAILRNIVIMWKC